MKTFLKVENRRAYAVALALLGILGALSCSGPGDNGVEQHALTAQALTLEATKTYGPSSWLNDERSLPSAGV